jgi:hypothetical protein
MVDATDVKCAAMLGSDSPVPDFSTVGTVLRIALPSFLITRRHMGAASISSTVHPHVYEVRRNQETQPMEQMTLRRIAITLISGLAMFATSVNAETTKKGHVFSNSPGQVTEFMSRIQRHDTTGAMGMIKEGKVHPLKEGLDVVIVEVTGDPRIVRFTIRGTPPGVFSTKGTYYTDVGAIQR